MITDAIGTWNELASVNSERTVRCDDKHAHRFVTETDARVSRTYLLEAHVSGPLFNNNTGIYSMTWSIVKVKVTSPCKSEIRPFSNAISSPFIMGAGKWPRIHKLGGNT